MKIISWACVCPVCRYCFTAYLADVQNPERDEIAHDKRTLLCNVCERRFINRLYRAMIDEVTPDGPVSLERLCLSAMCTEAHRAREPRPEAEVGSGPPCGLPRGVQGLSPGDRDTDVPQCVSGVHEEAGETLRGATVLPADESE